MWNNDFIQRLQYIFFLKKSYPQIIYEYLLKYLLIIIIVCWRGSYGRGPGSPLSACSSDQDKNGALCYPKCQDGYYGVGPVNKIIC